MISTFAFRDGLAPVGSGRPRVTLSFGAVRYRNHPPLFQRNFLVCFVDGNKHNNPHIHLRVVFPSVQPFGPVFLTLQSVRLRWRMGRTTANSPSFSLSVAGYTANARTFGETVDIAHWLDKVWFLLWLPAAFWTCGAASGNLCLPMVDGWIDPTPRWWVPSSLLACIPGRYFCHT